MDVRKLNRLWLFFMVVATALVWTWSRVGQHPTDGIGAEGADVRLLKTEADCDLARGPCAAYQEGLAVVAVGKVEGEGVRWRVRLVGRDGLQPPQLVMLLLTPGAPAQQLAVLQTGDEWLADSPRRVAPGSTLRVRIEDGHLPLVADFPLRGSRTP